MIQLDPLLDEDAKGIQRMKISEHDVSSEIAPDSTSSNYLARVHSKDVIPGRNHRLIVGALGPIAERNRVGF